MRILIVKMSSMGDIIHNMPLIHDIKQQHPDAVIDWLVEEAFVELVRLNPLVNQVIAIALRRWKKNVFAVQTWHEISAFKKRLRDNEYDYILDTQGLIKSALMAALALGKSYGQNAKSSHEYPAHWFLKQPLNIPKNLHAITRNRLTGALALNYALRDDAPHYDIVLPKQDAELNKLIPNNCVMLVHSTAREAKHWPNDYWVQLGKTLNAQGYALVLPWGSALEKTRAQTIASQLTNAIVLPKLSIVQLAYCLSKSIACVGLDTGLMHIAVAINKPTLAIFTDTHSWQAGTQPAIDGRAITIGGKPSLPAVDAVYAAFNDLITHV